MIVLLVHGWSVRNTNTYGELAARLKTEGGNAADLPIDVRNIWLSKYVSFRDEVRLEDLSRAFEAAIRRELGAELNKGCRFACIAHSTGGPVIRDWWDRFYLAANEPCPMSHLVMLAPANFGSALAQLGKQRLSRLRAWFQGVEPGQGVLDWLELGSQDSWDLNYRWITKTTDPTRHSFPVFPFVLTGQTIDRSLYDHLNSYTGEIGSDGVVRVAAANLNANYIKLVQERESGRLRIDRKASRTATLTAFVLIPRRSHSGEKKGILRSIRDDGRRHPTVTAILACLKVNSHEEYERLRDRFARTNDTVRRNELVERVRGLLTTREFVHDRRSMVIVRVQDDYGHPVEDFDFLLAGKGGDPDLLPVGFFADRQRNSLSRNTLTYFVNHTVLVGAPRVVAPDDPARTIREEQAGVERLGVEIAARPETGFVHYMPAALEARQRNVTEFLRPDHTTLLDIVLHRVVRRGAFELVSSDLVEPHGEDFTEQPPGGPIA
jgi:hypothetical protein